MQKLKDAYNIKKDLIYKDISDLGDSIKKESNIEIVNVNSDNTLYLESNCGMDSINDNINKAIIKTIYTGDNGYNIIHKLIYNILPLSNNSCVVRI